jgi:hypothetical protein
MRLVLQGTLGGGSNGTPNELNHAYSSVNLGASSGIIFANGINANRKIIGLLWQMNWFKFLDMTLCSVNF